MPLVAPALLKRADFGDKRAQTEIAFLYEKGDKVAQDFKEAANWYRRAADQSEANAQWRIAQFYKKGLGVEQNDIEAYFWELLAAKFDMPDDAWVPDHSYYAARLSSDDLAAIRTRADNWKPTLSELERGKAAFQCADYNEAFSLLKPLAEKGCTDAQAFLHTMYKNGWGVQKDGGEATRWGDATVASCHLAAEQGDGSSQLDLFQIYFHGSFNVKQDYVEAYFWLCVAGSRMSFGLSKKMYDFSDKITPKQKSDIEARATEWVKRRQ